MYDGAVPPRRAVRRLVRAAIAARPRPRIRLDNDERRAQLLQLARKAFSDRSYDDVSIDDLAREAKISKGLLYHYFPTKRHLYVAGLREIAEELVQRVTAIPTNLPPAARARRRRCVSGSHHVALARVRLVDARRDRLRSRSRAGDRRRAQSVVGAVL